MPSERDWLEKYWKAGLPKHDPKMHYYLNTFPNGEGRWRPVWVVTGWAFTISAAGLLLPPQDLVTSLSVRTALVALFVVGLWTLPILDASQRAEILRAVRLMIAAGRRHPDRGA